MKLRKIELTNDPVLGNFILDLTDKNGKAVNTVILAGENGTGKSYLLDVIFDLSRLSIHNLDTLAKRKYEIELNDKEIEILKGAEEFKRYFENGIVDNVLHILVDYSIKQSWDQNNITAKSPAGKALKIPGNLFNNPTERQVTKTIFSDVEINFTPQEIKTVTSKNVDSSNASEKSKNSLATEITQLLIDVQSVDALDFTEWARKNQGQQIDPEKIDVRIRRFTNAFHYIFPTKRYNRIETSKGKKQVIFEENGREMDIDKLSSGEKQIVFRGSFLLKNRESSKGALILIDEPEISLHPNWQLLILNFFKKLFTDNHGIQTSQLIVSTHSPFIIHNSNRNDDKVIVLRKNTTGNTEVLSEPKFLGWTNERIVQNAFNIHNLLSDSKTKIFVEGETDEKYFNKALEIFGHNSSNLSFKWIGRINEKGNAENTGNTALNQARVFFMANIELIQGKVILLYDSDTNKPEETFGPLSIKKMPVNSSNTTFKIGVENLLNIQGINISQFYKQRKKVDEYGAESTISELDKTKLCDYICSLDSNELKKVLTNLESEINKLLV